MKKKGGKMVPNCVPKGSMKKEEVTGGILVQDAEDFKPREIESVDIIKADPIKGGQLQELVRTKDSNWQHVSGYLWLERQDDDGEVVLP